MIGRPPRELLDGVSQFIPKKGMESAEAQVTPRLHICGDLQAG